MRHQSREEKKRKKQPLFSEGHVEPEVLTEDEIDPADFFDPEEFGFRRRGFDATRT